MTATRDGAPGEAHDRLADGAAQDGDAVKHDPEGHGRAQRCIDRSREVLDRVRDKLRERLLEFFQELVEDLDGHWSIPQRFRLSIARSRPSIIRRSFAWPALTQSGCLPDPARVVAAPRPGLIERRGLLQKLRSPFVLAARRPACEGRAPLGLSGPSDHCRPQAREGRGQGRRTVHCRAAFISSISLRLTFALTLAHPCQSGPAEPWRGPACARTSFCRRACSAWKRAERSRTSLTSCEALICWRSFSSSSMRFDAVS